MGGCISRKPTLQQQPEEFFNLQVPGPVTDMSSSPGREGKTPEIVPQAHIDPKRMSERDRQRVLGSSTLSTGTGSSTKKRDKYINFQALADVCKEGADYSIICRNNASHVAVIAPHGGGIEPGTSEIARAIAGDDLSFYAFQGVRPEKNSELHITSENFDEPRGIGLV